ncbi:MAG: hypothetical protein A3E83_04675 [Gammaproteobacteria bacterium RIFCSPHIGHO2_12_FULL_41_20]|nr:MAG: hypothetical protein A3E83_04675 [Gammaproteobacteria bacterium RIFCSPHIGHO2_12_FULL_41_20]
MKRIKKNINKILVATDFSKSSQFAILRAAEIAKKNKATLTILHITKSGFLEKIIPIVGKILVTPEEYAASLLKEQIRRLYKYKIKIAYLVESGDHPGPKILKHAKDNKIDLLVMGAHGKYSIHDWFVGTTAEYIARKTSCPVLIIKKYYHKPYKKILFPIDFSKASKDTLQFSRTLFPKNHFHILHVGDHEYENFIERKDSFPKNKIKTLRNAVTFLLYDKVKKFIKNCGGRSRSFSYDIKLGYPSVVILEEAKKLNQDLIIMGTAGHSRRHYLFIGRTASRVLIEVDRDILLVPPREK